MLTEQIDALIAFLALIIFGIIPFWVNYEIVRYQAQKRRRDSFLRQIEEG